MDYLDRGYGECFLRQSQLAEIAAQSLHPGDGQNYHLGDFVIMPNNVHLLCGLIGVTEIESQCHSWKKYTARQINTHLGRKGRSGKRRPLTT